jgi:hypothetical protein
MSDMACCHHLKITSELSLAYIGTDSRTEQRDEHAHRSRRFRLGGKKETAGAAGTAAAPAAPAASFLQVNRPETSNLLSSDLAIRFPSL